MFFVFLHQDLYRAFGKRQNPQGVFRFGLADHKLMVNSADAFGDGKRAILYVQIFPKQSQQFSAP